MILDIALKVRLFDKLSNTMIFFEYVDFWPKILLFRDPPPLKLHNRNDINLQKPGLFAVITAVSSLTLSESISVLFLTWW